MRALLAIVLLAWGSAHASELPAFADGSFATGSWADGSWGNAPPAGDPFTAVIGLSLAAADAALEGDGFDTGVVVTRCSTEMANIVLSQSPVAGTPSVEGTLANLVASNGMECTIRVRGRPSFGFN